MRVPF
ncbi:hypothetical protein VULLAG_LOCUS16015 [Vulpes lagopus]